MEPWLSSLWSPRVGVVASDAVEECASANQLRFADMLLPFASQTSELSIKDPSANGSLLGIRNMRIDFRDVFRDQQLTDNALNHLLHHIAQDAHSSGDVWHSGLVESVVRWGEPGQQELVGTLIGVVIAVSAHEKDPLDMFTILSQKQHAIQHTKWSGTQEPGRVEGLRWFLPNIFKYYVLVHDVSKGDQQGAEALYQQMKTGYGAHACHMLRVNSAAPSNNSLPDPWKSYLHDKYGGLERALSDAAVDLTKDEPTTAVGDVSAVEEVTDTDTNDATGTEPAGRRTVRTESIPHALSTNDIAGMVSQPVSNIATGAITPQLCTVDCVHGGMLSSDDRERMQVMVQELLARGLLPFVERQLAVFTQQIHNRRGVMGKIPSRSWLPGILGGKTTTVPTSHTQAVVYTPESSEMQLRRLADLAFLLRQYNMAYNSYYTLKKDFYEAKAWLHYAAAAEMCAICAFMVGPQVTGKPFPVQYIDSAMTTYAVTCSRPLLGLRAVLISGFIMKQLRLYGDAAAQFIRMTNAECQLSSGVLLEQAAHCFVLNSMPRKSAFHLILSGHRYSKAGLKDHAVRTYLQAAEVYAGRDWHAIEDHIASTVGSAAEHIGIKGGQAPKTPSTSIAIEDSSPQRHSLTPAPQVTLASDGISRRHVTCRIKCANRVQHDFSSGPCRVSVCVTVENGVPDKVTVQVVCFAGQELFVIPRRGAPPLAYTQRTECQLELSIGGEETVNLVGVVFTPGLFDVSSFVLVSSQCPQIIVPPHFISVTSLNPPA